MRGLAAAGIGSEPLDALRDTLEKLLAEKPHRLVFSAPRAGGRYVKATLVRHGQGRWQAERLDGKKAFHRNFGEEGLLDEAAGMLAEEFTQLAAFSDQREMSVRVTKKGKLLYNSRPGGAPPQKADHDREKAHIIPEGVVVPPLVDMGVMDATGRVLAARRDKYRQINRFIELVDDVVRQKDYKQLRVVDFGCGKSYLTFLLYYYLTEIRGIEADITGLDLKADVVEHCNLAARKYGYSGLRFAVGDIANHSAAHPVDMVVTLHACDTATDHALAKAVAWQSGLVFSVPCCQHELNAQMESEELAILTRYGIVQERTAALMTDAIRANLLAACGYSTQLLEFVDMEHTPKNLMIRAKKANLPMQHRKKALDEVERLCRAFRLSPTLLRLLKEQKMLPE